MEKIPKVFISYSWSGKEFEKKVEELATRLMGHQVNVLFDKWYLTPGQNKYKFMEKAVVDRDIDKILIICDRRYKEKADHRIGGVGEETLIISPQLYQNQSTDKFIPVIFEFDENKKPYCPAYIESIIYIDLSSADTYEKEYEKLLRAIYNIPLHKKPPIGKKPRFLFDELSLKESAKQ
jgi:hypothetical protein